MKAGLSRMMFRVMSHLPEKINSEGSPTKKKSSKKLLPKRIDSTVLQLDSPQYRIPSFARQQHLNGHMFEVNGEVYEYCNGQFFKKLHTLPQGSSFGEIAL